MEFCDRHDIFIAIFVNDRIKFMLDMHVPGLLYSVLYEIKRRLTYNDTAFAFSRIDVVSRWVVRMSRRHPQANIRSFEFIVGGGGPSGLSRVRQLYFRCLRVWLFVSITAVRCGPQENERLEGTFLLGHPAG